MTTMDTRKGSKNKKCSSKGPVLKKLGTRLRPGTAKTDDDSGIKSSYQMDFTDYTGVLSTERNYHILHDPTLRQTNPRADPPGEPSEPRVSDVTATSCVLEWNEPEDDGGSPLERYHVQFRAGGSSGWAAMRGGSTTETRHQLTRLTPGTVYKFRVAAENAADVGVGGPESHFIQAAQPPDLPSKPEVTESSRTHCLLSWKPPQFSGGSAITGYHVEYRTTWPETSKWSRVTNGIVLGNQYTVRDVEPVTSYYFRIVAVNKTGEGNPGIESEIVETIDLPGCVDAPEVRDINTASCVLAWRPPDDDGGVPVLGYHVERKDSSGWMRLTETLNPGTSFKARDLIKSSKYRFRISAVNKKGEGQEGHESAEIEAIDPPGRVDAPAVRDINAASCVLAWRPPDDDGGAPVLGYHIEQCRTDSSVWMRLTETLNPGMSFKARDLIKSSKYRFRISAVNKKGEGQEGHESAEIEAIDPPGCVDAPAVRDINAASCVLSWRPPDDDGGAPVLGYHVEQCRTDSFGWIRLTKTLNRRTSFKARDLIKSSKYRFRISAVNKKGEGQEGHESAEIEAIEPPPPPAKRPAVCDITFQSCMVSWEPPSGDGGSPITGYRIEQKLSSGTSWTTVGCTTSQLYTIKASVLTENCLYCFRVRAINKAGEGTPRDTSDFIQTTGQDMSDANSIALIQTNQLEEWGMTRVKAAFQRGLNSINMLVESILPLRNSVSFREIQHVGSTLRHYSAEAYFNMRDAQDKAERLNKELNKRLEALMYKKGQKERDMGEKENRCAELRAEMAEKQAESKMLKEELDSVSAEYFRSQDRLETAKQELADKKRERDTVRGVGAGLFAIPIFGWIAGAVMVTVSFTALEEKVEAAEGNCDSARQSMDSQRSRISEKKSQISICEKQIDKNESEKSTLRSQIGALESNITDLQAQFKHQSTVSEHLRMCVTFISRTAGHTEVLHDQVKFLYNPATIVGPLMELAAHLSLPEMDTFGLQTDNLKAVDAFVSKLKMIVDADDCWKQDNILDFKKDHKVLMATESGTAQQKRVGEINSVVDRMYTDESSKEDREKMLSQHAGWEEFLVPAPMSIAFLGQLMLLTTQKDFPLDKHAPTGGFRFLKYPKSFRTTVLQVANTGWDAFNTANHSMDQIRVYANTLPLHLRSGFDILSSASHEEVEHFLPLCLSSVKNVAEKCLSNAQSTEDGFVLVMDTVAELQEACVSSKGFYEKQRQYAQISLDVAAEQRKAIGEEKEFLSKQKEQIKESIEEAEKQFDEAITSLPNGWNLLGMAVVEGILDATSAVFSKASITYKNIKKKLKNGSDKQGDVVDDIDESTRKAYKQSIALHTVVNELSCTFVDGEALKRSEVMNSSKMVNCDIEAKRIVKALQTIKNGDIKKKVLQLAGRTSSLCTRIKEVKENLSEIKKEDINCLAIDISNLLDEVSVLAGEGQSLMESCPRLRPPNMKSWQSRDEPDNGAVKSAINKARVKTEGSCQMLKNAQQNYDKISEDLTDASDRLSDVLAEMAGLELEKLDFEKIIDILHRGLVALGSIREQWGKMVHFFQTIVNIIDCSLNESLKMVQDVSDKSHKSPLEGYTLCHLKRDMLHQQITHVSELAWFVSMIAESYTEISAKHLMPRVDGLPKLLSFDSEKDRHAIQLKMSNLHTECKDAQEEIARLLSRKKREFDRNVNKRVNCLQSEMRRSIGGTESKKTLKGQQTGTTVRETTQNQSVCVEDFI